MKILEIVISFLIGFSAAGLLGFIFRLKTKGMKRVAANALCGGAIFCLLPFLGAATVAINPLNALLTGFLGLPGLAAVFVLSAFL